jgi:hypothetical protein
MAKAKAVFIFVTPDADLGLHNAIIFTPEGLDLMMVGVRDCQAAAQVAKGLVGQGFEAIKLYSGCDNFGIVKVIQAVGNKTSIEVVCFDYRPLLGFQCGDELIGVEMTI